MMLLGWFSTNHFPPWVSWYAEAPFFAGVVLLSCWALWSAWRTASIPPVSIPPVAWPFLGLLIATLFQSVAGQVVFLGTSVVVGMYLCLAVATVLLAHGVSHTAASAVQPQAPVVLVLIAWTLLAGGIFSVGIALCQVFEVWGSSSWVLRMSNARRGGSNIGQPNHLATLLVMALASAYYLHARKRLSGVTLWVLLAYLGSGLVISDSRTGTVSLAALLVWWVAKRSRVAPTVSIGAAVVLVALMAAMHSGWPRLFGLVQGGAAVSSIRLDTPSGDARLTVWPQLLQASLDRPWLGWGMGQTAMAHNSVASDHDISRPFSYSHNLVLDLALWVGWPLTIALGVMCVVWLWRRIPLVKGPDAWYGLAVALPLAVHSLLEFPFAYAYLLVPALIGLGAAEALVGPRPRWQMDVRVVAGSLAIFAAVSAWTVVEYLHLEEEFRLARFSMLRIGPAHLSRAGADVVLLTQVGSMARSTRVELKPDMSTESLDLLKNVALNNPSSAPQYRYAMALALNKQPEEALRMLKVIRAQHGIELHDTFRRQIDQKRLASGMGPLGPQ